MCRTQARPSAAVVVAIALAWRLCGGVGERRAASGEQRAVVPGCLPACASPRHAAAAAAAPAPGGPLLLATRSHRGASERVAALVANPAARICLQTAQEALGWSRAAAGRR